MSLMLRVLPAVASLVFVFAPLAVVAEEAPAAAPAAPVAAPAAAPAPAPTPAPVPVEAPKVDVPAAVPAAEAPKAESPKAEEPKAEKPAKPVDEKRVSKMRERWRNMTPEKREEIRKKAERRLGERYERLKPSEQTQVDKVVAEIEKLSKEQRSILLAKVRQKAYKEKQQRKLMKGLDAATKNQEKAAPAAIESVPVAAPAASHE